MLNYQIIKLLGVAILMLAFMFASVPMSSLDNDDDMLRTAIIKVKRLENSTQHDGRDFNTILSNAVVALKTAAQFSTFIFPFNQNSETDSAKIVLNVKLLVITVQTGYVANLPGFGEALQPPEIFSLYRSLSISPETPPPESV